MVEPEGIELIHQVIVEQCYLRFWHSFVDLVSLKFPKNTFLDVSPQLKRENQVVVRMKIGAFVQIGVYLCRMI